MRSEETTVLLVYSVYFSKFTSEILILVRKAASKQVEAIIKAFANTNQRRKAKVRIRMRYACEDLFWSIRVNEIHPVKQRIVHSWGE